MPNIVEIRGATKSYGLKNRKEPVLNNLNLTIPVGAM